MHQIPLLANNFKFLDQIYPEKVNIIIEFCRFLIQILISWTKYAQKGISSQNWKSEVIIEFFIFKLALEPNFSSNWQFLFFGSNFPKNIYPVENRKSEYHHRILHIWITPGTKFQSKLIILSFRTKFTQIYPVENRANIPRTTSLCFSCTKR